MPTDFSIDSLLSKPKTDFSIARILGLQEGGEPSNARGYLVLNSHISRYRKFGMVQHVTECVLRNPAATREAALGYLERAFTNLMNEAYEREPQCEMVSVIIESDNLQGPIPIPPRSREQNTPEAIVRKIDETSSSATAANLLYSKMRVIITTLTPPENIQKAIRISFQSQEFLWRRPEVHDQRCQRRQILSFLRSGV
ncbi:hypothetical protein Ddc_13336 [Ditylenchus destructor]|nr:hypothetical protein Ddc_13336 [Ditylenchus destructor]